MEYDNNNSAVLFKNDKGDNPKRPEYTGRGTIDGVEKRLAAWVKTSKSGQMFMSIKFTADDYDNKPKQPQAAHGAHEEDVPF